MRKLCHEVEVSMRKEDLGLGLLMPRVYCRFVAYLRFYGFYGSKVSRCLWVLTLPLFLFLSLSPAGSCEVWTVCLSDELLQLLFLQVFLRKCALSVPREREERR